MIDVRGTAPPLPAARMSYFARPEARDAFTAFGRRDAAELRQGMLTGQF